MVMRRIVFINQSTTHLPFADLLLVTQALQTQIDRDFAPLWGIRAQITALRRHDPLPAGAWVLRLVDDAPEGSGIQLNAERKPFAFVQATADWSVQASHALLEMLAAPMGHFFVRAPDITPASDGHLVWYLMEVSDPCEVFSYTIGDVPVADFVTPDYFDPATDLGVAVDFLGQLSRPYEVPEGCCLSWIDPLDGAWHHKTPEGDFAGATIPVDPYRNPRQDRDAKLPLAGYDRHDLARIRQAYYGRR